MKPGALSIEIFAEPSVRNAKEHAKGQAREEGRSGIVDKTIVNSVNNTKVTRIKVCSLESTNKDTLRGFIQDRVKSWGRV